jgi:hypothetical protein
MIYAVADAHVHLHADATASLEFAAANLIAAASRPATLGILFLTETEGVDHFGGICAQAGRRIGNVYAVAGDGCLWWKGDARLPILLIAGRQIVTAEGLEVLALGTVAKVSDGLPIADVLAWCEARGAVAVIPWGVGKWVGRRGRVVKDLVLKAAPGRLMLGDNAGRPGFWRMSAFTAGAGVKSRILSGSDALPLPGSERGIGRFGFGMAFYLDLRDPRGSVLQALRAPDTRIDAFGPRRPIARFLKDQAMLRWRSARRKAAT